MYTLHFPRARIPTIDIYVNVLEFKESCFDFISNTMLSNWENTPLPDLNYLVWTDERTDRQTYTYGFNCKGEIKQISTGN